MSKYTTEVRYICEHYAGLKESEGYEKVDDIIKAARSKVFDFDYPIFDTEYKSTIEEKILRHYYTREIGLETVGLWKHFLNMKMNEIMPYYNQLYKSALLEFDPFGDVDYTRQGTRSGNESREETREDSREDNRIDSKEDNTTRSETGTNRMTGTVVDDGESSSTDSGSDSKEGHNVPKNSKWTLYSDTPQGGVAGIEAAEASVGSNAYLTNATHEIEDATGSSNTEEISYGKVNDSTTDNTRTYNTTNTITNTGTEKLESDGTSKLTSEGTGSTSGTTESSGEYFERIKGKMFNKSYAELLQELRKTFLNIDLLVINELGDLFLNIY